MEQLDDQEMWQYHVATRQTCVNADITTAYCTMEVSDRHKPLQSLRCFTVDTFAKYC